MKQALLVIDAQRALFDEAPRPHEADGVIGRINGLAKRARAVDVPVIWVQHESASGALAPESEGWRLACGLEVGAADHRVGKTTPDAFLGTRLQALLDALGAREVVVCGYASEFCVDTTVRRAAALGYRVALVADAHTTHDKPHARAAWISAHHNATLPEITSFGPRIATVASADFAFLAAGAMATKPALR